MSEPQHNRGKSKQDYRTPKEFLSAVKRQLGVATFTMDLAATKRNAVAPRFFTRKDNALAQPWPDDEGGWSFLNPPFAKIEPWVRKAWNEGAHTAVLVPAGVGSNWWKRWVHNKAHVLFVNGRLTFVGAETCYPKDCALLLYGTDIKPGYQPWTWGDATVLPIPLFERDGQEPLAA